MSHQFVSQFFFFFISNKDVYSRTLPYAESHKVEKKLQREKIKEREREREREKEKILITKERAREHRERITSGESPSPRPIKKGATERSQQLVIRTCHVLKRPPISLPPKIPH